MMRSEPFGYIKRGPLYGWQGEAKYNDTNNPFWSEQEPENYNLDMNSLKREPFRSHVWTEFELVANQPARVIDVCHAIFDANQNPVHVLSAGQHTQDAYLDFARSAPPQGAAPLADVDVNGTRPSLNSCPPLLLVRRTQLTTLPEVLNPCVEIVYM